jgi:hypothetical protein
VLPPSSPLKVPDAGTKLLANILLSSTATVGRQAEKAVRLTCYAEAPVEAPEGEVEGEAGEPDTPVEQKLAVVPISYLFKTDTVEASPPPSLSLSPPDCSLSQNTDKLLACIEEELRRSKAAASAPSGEGPPPADHEAKTGAEEREDPGLEAGAGDS